MKYDGVHAELTSGIVGCAIEVHRHSGPGLLESVYESALCREFTLQGFAFERQVCVPLHYKDRPTSHRC